jgi:hypothetical protein
MAITSGVMKQACANISRQLEANFFHGIFLHGAVVIVVAKQEKHSQALRALLRKAGSNAAPPARPALRIDRRNGLWLTFMITPPLSEDWRDQLIIERHERKGSRR